MRTHDLVYLPRIHPLVVLGSKYFVALVDAENGRLLPEFERKGLVCTGITPLRDGRHFLTLDKQMRLHCVDERGLSIVRWFDLDTDSRLREPGIPCRGVEVSSEGRWAVAFNKMTTAALIDSKPWEI